MFYAFFADFFPPGGGDTPMTEEHIDKLGMKATPRNRAIVFALSLLLTVAAVWKMFWP
jgi:type II secretory pathway component PulM